MATIYQNLQSLLSRQPVVHFNLGEWIEENVTRSWWLSGWLAALTYVTIRFTLGQLSAAPMLTGLVLAFWLLSLGAVILASLFHRHTAATLWIKYNLYNSVTNVQLTLILTLAILAALRAFIGYALINASWTTDPAAAAASGFTGANWGAILDNMRNFLVFRFPGADTWRIGVVMGMLLLLAVPSLFVYRPSFRRRNVRRVLTLLWLLTPIVTFVLLHGVSESGPLRRINPDVAWGGLMLTVIISVFAIVVSFPLGVLLALGRRSQIRGIPAWLTWGVAVALTVWGLVATTPENVAAARGPFQQLLAYWPLLIPFLAYGFQRYFRGNVVAAFSTTFIELVRGVPLITVLFMGIILFPIFLPPNLEILNTWRVLAGFALFSAAYLAENVRGGLQAIAHGQYEAADALGLSTYQKYRLIILPQALRAVIPAIVGQFIGLFKDTSLIAIVGLFDLLGVANSISAQPQWLGVRQEAYIFVALVYYVGSAIMTGYSRRLEVRLGVGER